MYGNSGFRDWGLGFLDWGLWFKVLPLPDDNQSKINLHSFAYSQGIFLRKIPRISHNDAAVYGGSYIKG